MIMLQLNPTIPLDTPKGRADAHFVIDYGSEHNLWYTCFVRETGECWTYQSTDVRLEKNITGGVRVGDRVDEPTKMCCVEVEQFFRNRLVNIERICVGVDHAPLAAYHGTEMKVLELRKMYEDAMLASVALPKAGDDVRAAPPEESAGPTDEQVYGSDGKVPF